MIRCYLNSILCRVYQIVGTNTIYLFLVKKQKRKRRLSEPGGGIADILGMEGLDNEPGPVLEEEDLQISILPAPILPKAPSVEAMKPLTVNTEFTTPLGPTEARR